MIFWKLHFKTWGLAAALVLTLHLPTCLSFHVPVMQSNPQHCSPTMAVLFFPPPPLQNYLPSPPVTSSSNRHGACFSLSMKQNNFPEDEISPSNLQHSLERLQGFKARVKPILRLLGRKWHIVRKGMISFAVALFVAFFLTFNSSAWAVSGGRMGGSFRPSKSSSPPSQSRPSMSRPMPRSSSSYHRSSPSLPKPGIETRRRSNPPIVIFHQPQIPPVQPFYYSAGRANHNAALLQNGFSARDVLLLTGTGALIAYGFTHKNSSSQNGRRRYRDRDNHDTYDNKHQSALGPGATTTSITVCLDVPDRDAPGSILSRLNNIADRVDTSSRKGVQDMVSEVALELLRQEKSIFSAYSRSEHYRKPSLAERDFQQRSIESRSKFDREIVNKFGNQDLSERRQTLDTSEDNSMWGKATSAVVTIHLAIEGDSLVLSDEGLRSNMLRGLRRIATDSRIEDCLLAAEVLWTPDTRSEVLTRNEVYADYPELVPVL